MRYLRLRVNGSAGIRLLGHALENIRGKESLDGVLIDHIDFVYDVFVPFDSDTKLKKTRGYEFITEVQLVDSLPSTASNLFDTIFAESNNLKDFNPLNKHLEAYLQDLDPSRKGYTPERQMKLYHIHRTVIETCQDRMDPTGEVLEHIDKKIEELKKSAGAEFN